MQSGDEFHPLNKFHVCDQITTLMNDIGTLTKDDISIDVSNAAEKVV